RWSVAHGVRRIVEGDFNATPWSPSFHRLLDDGHLTSSLDGFGLQVSWPESNVLLRIPIDHALLGPALAATDRGTGPSFDSQHRSLHVTVAPARSPPTPPHGAVRALGHRRRPERPAEQREHRARRGPDHQGVGE